MINSKELITKLQIIHDCIQKQYEDMKSMVANAESAIEKTVRSEVAYGYARQRDVVNYIIEVIENMVEAKPMSMYVDTKDIAECATFRDFPIPGDLSKIYVSRQTGVAYLWNPSTNNYRNYKDG